MRSRFSFIVRSLLISVAAFVLLIVGLREANALGQGVTVGPEGNQAEPAGDGPIVQATERISIPFGFDAALPLADDGSLLVVSGQGACTAEEDATIVFTVTQSSSGAIATGVWNGTCTGQLQTWTQAPTATPSPNFEAGEAEACADIVTRDSDEVTDIDKWCNSVFLASDHVYLPFVARP